MEKNDDLDILVNKMHKLNKRYVPNNLVDIYNPYYKASFKDGRLQVRGELVEYLEKMNKEATYYGFPLYVSSGYRSYEYQEKLLRYFLIRMGREAFQRVAPPGASEHQTGLGVDLTIINDDLQATSIKADTPAFQYLTEDAWKHGFILRYPEGKEKITLYSFEPWHYRFVGVDTAEYITKNGLTLEEYHEERKSNIAL